MRATFFFFGGVYLLGLSWSLLARSRLGTSFCVAAAYPLGLLIWALASWSVGDARLSSLSGSVGPVWVGLVAAGAVAQFWVSRQKFSSHDYWILGSGTILFGLSLAAALRWDLSVWTYDSHVIVSLGRSIAYHEGIPSLLAPELTSRGLLQAMMHGASLLVDQPYFYAAPPMLAVSFLVLFGTLGCRALEGPGRVSARTACLVALTTVAMGSSYLMIVHYFYMHENFAAATFLFLFCACYWFAEQEREPAWLAFAFLFLLAFSLNRVEAPIVAALLLLIAHSQSTLPSRTLNIWLSSYLIGVLAWYGVLLGYFGEGHFHLRVGPHVLNTGRILAIQGGLAACLVVGLAIRLPRFSGVRRYAAGVLLGILGVGIFSALILRPEHMATSGLAMLANMRDPAWGGTWYVLGILCLLSMVRARPRFHQIFTLGSVALIAVVYLLSFARIPYMVTWGDTGHRMSLSAIPLLFFYVLISYGPTTLGHRLGGSGVAAEGDAQG